MSAPETWDTAPGTLSKGISLPLTGVMATPCATGSAGSAGAGSIGAGAATGACRCGRATRCFAGAAFLAGFGRSGCDWMIGTAGSSTAPGEGAAPGCGSVGAAGTSGVAAAAGGCGTAGAGTAGACGCAGLAGGVCVSPPAVCAALMMAGSNNAAANAKPARAPLSMSSPQSISVLASKLRPSTMNQ